MKRAGVISTAILFLLLGTSVPAYAQHEEQGKSQQGQQHQQAQPAQQQHQQPAQQQQHAQQQNQNKQQQQEHQQPAQQQQHAQQQNQNKQQQQQAKKPAQSQGKPQQSYGGVYHGGVQPSSPTYGGVHPSGVPQHQGQVHSGFTQSRASSWNNDHRTWGQRGGYNGYRVPQDRFNLYFGSNHYFRVYGLPLVFVGGYPRFQYDGYWVTFLDPWPEMWPDTWYQTDDVYLDYTDDGYYLYNRSRPGFGIAVTIAF